MDRLEKCRILKEKGFTYNPNTGKVYGIKGSEITSKNSKGYIVIGCRGITNLRAHHFAWYMTYGNVDFEMLDHINQDKTDNRISNLRMVNNQQNKFNTSPKGYSWDKNRNKWKANIKLNYKTIYIGRYDTEDEAKNAYLKAKKIYHII